MANWSPDFTPRVIVKYTHIQRPHSWTLRFARGTSMSTAYTEAASVLAALTLNLTTILGDDLAATEAFFIEQDSNVQIPYSEVPDLEPGVNPWGDFSSQDKDTEVRFPGKTSGGLVQHLSVFSAFLSMDGTLSLPVEKGILPAGTYNFINNAVATLNGSALVGNDNNPTIWYRRATCKRNDYWLRQSRKGGA